MCIHICTDIHTCVPYTHVDAPPGAAPAPHPHHAHQQDCHPPARRYPPGRRWYLCNQLRFRTLLFRQSIRISDFNIWVIYLLFRISLFRLAMSISVSFTQIIICWGEVPDVQRVPPAEKPGSPLGPLVPDV